MTQKPNVDKDTKLFWQKQRTLGQFKKFEQWLEWRQLELRSTIEAIPNSEADRAISQRAIGEREALETLLDDWFSFIDFETQQIESE